MNDKFDELAKNMAQSVTRRGALKKFGIGLAGIVLASLGLANRATAESSRLSRTGAVPSERHKHCNCHKAYFGCSPSDLECIGNCELFCSP